jgi:protein SCO1/2
MTVGLLLAVLAAPYAAAQLADGVPEDLEEVAITQRLDEQLPLDLAFTDENGRAVRLGDYFDGRKPVVLTLGYYKCPMLCGLVLEGMLDAVEELDWTPGREFDIVTVSIDPREKPTLARLKKQTYIKTSGKPEAAYGWHFLTGEQEAIRALADTVGFRYKYVPDTGQFAHSAAIFVITPDGRIARYLFGVRYPAKTLRLSLIEAADGRIGSPVDQFLLYCYQYDETKGRYAPVAMRIMQLGASLSAIILGGVLIGLWRREARKRVR